jgi:Uma2 family endonuclease
MSAVSKQRWTVEEYLALERSSDEKHEYIDGEIYAMVGVTERHAAITMNTGFRLYGQFLDRDCRVYASDLRVRVPLRAYVYPDLVVVCGEAQFEDAARMTLLNPVVAIEVLSNSTERYDRVVKYELYREIPSMREYVMIAQHEARIDRFLWQEDGEWKHKDAVGLDAVLELVSIGCTLKLVDVYRQVTFE